MIQKMRIQNPFQPGIGEPPPFMGMRPDVNPVLDDMLDTLKNQRDPRAQFFCLYGPRGNGKTVLLRDLRKRAHKAAIRTLTLTPETMRSYADLITEIVSHLHENKHIVTCIKNNLPDVEGQVKITGVVDIGGDIKRPASTSIEMSLTRQFVATKQPLLTRLDEAHKEEVRPSVLGALMDAVQITGENVPIALALAGTPGLEDQLRAMGSSYWSRGHQLPVGRLDPMEAIKAVTEPLQKNAGFVTDTEAVECLVEEANCYPYFLQLYGRAAFDAVQAGGQGHFGMAECKRAVIKAVRDRREYHEERRQEFLIEDAIPLARTVAQAFIRHGRRMTHLQLEEVLAKSGSGMIFD